MEGAWSSLKRSIIGVYHNVIFKHLQLYCDEFTYRYKQRIATISERFNSSIEQVHNCRITCRELIAY